MTATLEMLSTETAEEIQHLMEDQDSLAQRWIDRFGDDEGFGPWFARQIRFAEVG